GRLGCTDTSPHLDRRPIRIRSPWIDLPRGEPDRRGRGLERDALPNGLRVPLFGLLGLSHTSLVASPLDPHHERRARALDREAQPYGRGQPDPTRGPGGFRRALL